MQCREIRGTMCVYSEDSPKTVLKNQYCLKGAMLESVVHIYM